MDRMGHAQIQTTQWYLHALDDADDATVTRAVDSLAALADDFVDVIDALEQRAKAT